jgi:hypothetical protein
MDRSSITKFASGIQALQNGDTADIKVTALDFVSPESGSEPAGATFGEISLPENSVRIPMTLAGSKFAVSSAPWGDTSQVYHATLQFATTFEREQGGGITRIVAGPITQTATFDVLAIDPHATHVGPVWEWLLALLLIVGAAGLGWLASTLRSWSVERGAINALLDVVNNDGLTDTDMPGRMRTELEAIRSSLHGFYNGGLKTKASAFASHYKNVRTNLLRIAEVREALVVQHKDLTSGRPPKSPVYSDEQAEARRRQLAHLVQSLEAGLSTLVDRVWATSADDRPSPQELAAAQSIHHTTAAFIDHAIVSQPDVSDGQFDAAVRAAVSAFGGESMSYGAATVAMNSLVASQEESTKLEVMASHRSALDSYDANRSHVEAAVTLVVFELGAAISYAILLAVVLLVPVFAGYWSNDAWSFDNPLDPIALGVAGFLAVPAAKKLVESLHQGGS